MTNKENGRKIHAQCIDENSLHQYNKAPIRSLNMTYYKKFVKNVEIGPKSITGKDVSKETKMLKLRAAIIKRIKSLQEGEELKCANPGCGINIFPPLTGFSYQGKSSTKHPEKCMMYIKKFHPSCIIREGEDGEKYMIENGKINEEHFVKEGKINTKAYHSVYRMNSKVVFEKNGDSQTYVDDRTFCIGCIEKEKNKNGENELSDDTEESSKEDKSSDTEESSKEDKSSDTEESSKDESSEDGSSDCLLYTSPSPRDRQKSRMPSSA